MACLNLSNFSPPETADAYEPKQKMSKNGGAKEDISLDKLIQTYTQFQNMLHSSGNEKLLTCLVMAFVRDNEADIEQCVKKLEVGEYRPLVRCGRRKS